MLTVVHRTMRELNLQRFFYSEYILLSGSVLSLSKSIYRCIIKASTLFSIAAKHRH
jgi:hypothetical protein